MKKLFAIVGLIGLTSAMPKFAHSAVSFSIFISNAPPPPRVAFVHEPRFVLVPAHEVYYCDAGYSDYDMFRYGSYYYLYDDGYWYRGPSYHGPFVAIRIEYVPSSIFYVSDYGYHWQQAPRWGSRSYARWDDGDRRFRDWRYSDRSYGERRYRDSDRRYAGSVERRDDGRRYVSREAIRSGVSDRWRSRSDVRTGVRDGSRREGSIRQYGDPWRSRSEARSGIRGDTWRSEERSGDRDRRFSDRRESRSHGGGEVRGRASRDRDGDDDNDRGRGNGKGKGNGKGHGRGHNKG